MDNPQKNATITTTNPSKRSKLNKVKSPALPRAMNNIANRFGKATSAFLKNILKLLLIGVLFNLLKESGNFQEEYPILWDLICGYLEFLEFGIKACIKIPYSMITFHFSEISEVFGEAAELLTSFVNWIRNLWFKKRNKGLENSKSLFLFLLIIIITYYTLC